MTITYSLTLLTCAMIGFGGSLAEAEESLNHDAMAVALAPTAAEPDRFQTFPGYQDIGCDQPYRPKFHFTSLKNWINDPNGLMYYDGEYHLFFQHNPLGIKWGNMSWGHAVSKDMVHWKQLPHALMPYGNGYMFSGSGVVDHNNSLGKQVGTIRTLVLLYSYAVDGRRDFGILPVPAETSYYQGLAYSTDRGRTFKLLNGGAPVIPNQGREVDPNGTERDPKLFWHEASGKWVAVLWLGDTSKGRVRFFNSDDLQHWTAVSDLVLPWAHECMDLMELPVLDANGASLGGNKWLIMDAGFNYQIGSFDGKVFVPEQKVANGKLGNWKAAQTFNNSPDGRRVIIGWMTASHFRGKNMPFSQQLTFPETMELRRVGNGIKPFRRPVKEIEGLYGRTWMLPGNISLAEAGRKLAEIHAECFDMSIELEPKGSDEVVLNLRGNLLTWRPNNNSLLFNKYIMPDALKNGMIKLRALLDRGSMELYLNDGETVLTHAVVPELTNTTLSLTGNAGRVKSAVVHELKSSWDPPAATAPLHHDTEAIRKAREGMTKEIPVATTDPHRPVYHFLPEARWLNDPNGAFFADGWYHVFYQHNPYGNDWGNIHWGHARSRDNVTWERLPVGVWPSTAKGEDHCYSGSAVKDGNGNWQLWYTSVSKVRDKDKDKGKLAWVFNGQVMLKPMDKEFVMWGKTTEDPVNMPTLPNNMDGYAWDKYIRDPAFFTAGGRTFMLLGITGKGAPIYEAKNQQLTEWQYRGIMCDDAWDCPQMIALGNKWIYVTSRGAPPRYSVGTFDPEAAKFTKETEGKLDQAANYHTISFSVDDKGRAITYSWITGTRKALGWNNCFALSRVITLDTDGHPRQNPVPELCKLRGGHEVVKELTGAKVLKTKGDTVEINAVFQQTDTGKCGLRVRRSADGTRALAITCQDGTLDVFGTKVAIAPEGAAKTLTLQVFLDKSIMEVFINGGKKSVVRVLYPPLEDQGLEAFSDGTGTVDVWQMRSIWPNRSMTPPTN